MPSLSRNLVLAVAGLLIGGSPGWAQPAGRAVMPGDRYTLQRTITLFEVTRTEDSNGKRLTDDITKEYITTYFVDTIVAIDEIGGKPTMLLRKYHTAERERDGQKSALPMSGKTVTIAKQKDGKYKFTAEDGELKGDDARLLEEEFNSLGEPDWQRLVGAAEPKRRGDRWQLDHNQAAKSLEQRFGIGLNVDEARSALEDRGREFSLNYPVEMMTFGNKRIVAKDSELLVEGRLNHSPPSGWDRSSTVTVRMALTGSIIDPKAGPLNVTILRVARTIENFSELRR